MNIPEGWTKLIIEFDGYRSTWLAWAIAPRSDGEFWWFKASGPTPSSAFAALVEVVDADNYIGKVPATTWAQKRFHVPTSPPPASLTAGIKINL